MPLGDGRGPWGLGPGTGRGRGPCGFGMAHRNLLKIPFGGSQRWIAGLGASLLAAVVRDLANPSGFLRHTAAALFSKKQSRDIRRVRRDAEFTILDRQPLTPDQKKET